LRRRTLIRSQENVPGFPAEKKIQSSFDYGEGFCEGVVIVMRWSRSMRRQVHTIELANATIVFFTHDHSERFTGLVVPDCCPGPHAVMRRSARRPSIYFIHFDYASAWFVAQMVRCAKNSQ
jgi:hypothetical protein